MVNKEYIREWIKKLDVNMDADELLIAFAKDQDIYKNDDPPKYKFFRYQSHEKAGTITEHMTQEEADSSIYTGNTLMIRIAGTEMKE